MSLLHLKLEEITLEQLTSTLMGDAAVREGQHIDYKREEVRHEQIAEAVASFANAHGGDLLLGIEEAEGVPIAINGVQVPDIDEKELQLLNMLRSKIEPRISNVKIHFVPISENKYVIIIRTLRSWLRPHRVSHNSKFFARQLSGKYELDYHQIRDLFLGSNDLTEKYTKFHAERVNCYLEKYNYETQPMAMLHFVPMSAFENKNQFDLPAVYEKLQIKKLFTTEHFKRYNFFGVASDSYDKSTYYQLFKNGITEHVTTRIARENKTSTKMLKRELEEVISWTMWNFRLLEINEPIYVMLAIYGTKGLTAYDVDGQAWSENYHPLELDRLVFPDYLIEDIHRVDTDVIIKPILDGIWNAYGFSHSPHFEN